MTHEADIAVKILRRRYSTAALHEVHVHDVTRRDGPCPEIARLIEGFVHDGHVCLAFERHGRSMNKSQRRTPLPLARIKQVTRQMLVALERLHRHGYAHTDVKPDNILYDWRSGEARLGDMGNGTNRLSQGSSPGTREYLAPEVLLGAPLGIGIDIWSLGCTVFEMLTLRRLFSPRSAAERKYQEFSAEAPEIELDQSVAIDEAAELAEQMTRGTIVGGRFRLENRLGQGRFGTVWSARRIADVDPTPWRIIWDHAVPKDGEDTTETERERSDRVWRRRKGADDLIDLALNYEHLLLMTALGGSLPPDLIASARFRDSYFDSAGALRFDAKVRRAPLISRLRRATKLGESDLESAAEFLAGLLVLDPSRRTTAGVLLEHPWLISGRGVNCSRDGRAHP